MYKREASSFLIRRKGVPYKDIIEIPQQNILLTIFVWMQNTLHTSIPLGHFQQINFKFFIQSKQLKIVLQTENIYEKNGNFVRRQAN